MGWGGRWEGGSGWGTHVNPWLVHVNVWQKPLQYCKVISLQLIKTIGKKEIKGYHKTTEKKEYWGGLPFPSLSNLPNPGVEPGSPALQVNSLPSESHKDSSLLNSVPFKSRNATSQRFQNLPHRSLLLPINTLYYNY